MALRLLQIAGGVDQIHELALGVTGKSSMKIQKRLRRRVTQEPGAVNQLVFRAHAASSSSGNMGPGGIIAVGPRPGAGPVGTGGAGSGAISSGSGAGTGLG